MSHVRCGSFEEQARHVDGEEDDPGLCSTPSADHGAVRITDVVSLPGFKEALVYAFKSDNSGPPNAKQVADVLDCIYNSSSGLSGLFPGSSPQVVGSTFDAFVSALLANPTAVNLPVVTQEIGDIWIYGMALPFTHHQVLSCAKYCF